MTDHLLDTARRLASLIGQGVSATGLLRHLPILVDEGYIAILPRQATLPAIEPPRIDVKGDPVGYATVLIGEMNHLTGRTFKVTEAVIKQAKTLLKAKVPLEQARQVIKAKHAEWKDDDKMAKYVCPGTLLRPSNMKRYLADLEAGPAKVGTGPTFKSLGDD